MHLCGPALSTTSTKKRTEKISKAKQAEFERDWRDRNQRLKEMHLPKETFDQYMEFVHGRVKKEKTTKKDATPTQDIFAGPTSTRTHTKVHSCKDTVTGPCSSKPSPTYTGTQILGIAVLHKSCLQPIFSNEEAVEVAHMRR